MRRGLVTVAAVAVGLGVATAAAPGWQAGREPRLIQPALYRAEAPVSATDPGLARTERDWLAAGTVPGRGTAWEPMATAALLDLHAYVTQDGSVAAGPGGPWRYTWPRDASFVALALARTGHAEQARAVFDHLARLPLGEDGFAARYHPDGRPVRDGRPPQSDGCGWVLWALAGARAADPTSVPASADGLRDRCTDVLVRLVRGGTWLPPMSQDYWELPVDGLTLGVAAPILAGLSAAADDYTRDLGADDEAARRGARAAAAAAGLAELVQRDFGPSYQRYGDRGGGWDAAAAVLLPPFTDGADPAVTRAWRRYQEEALRPAGGLAPGSRWDEKGSSWTPETALVAYTAAAAGHPGTATRWLRWLDRHRTAYGSLPEKVTRTGRPAGPAPLAWTTALVLLTLDELEQRGAVTADAPASSAGADGG